MREQRIRLEDQAYVSAVDRYVIHHNPPETNDSRVVLLKPGDHFEEGRFPTTGWPQYTEHFTCADNQRDIP
jgi:hypothetical protein